MLTEEVLVEEGWWQSPAFRVELQGLQGHLGNNFQGVGDLDRFGSGRPPGKGPMTPYQYGAVMQGIVPLQTFGNDAAGIPFVFALNFLWSHRPGHRNLSMEIVGMGRPETGNR